MTSNPDKGKIIRMLVVIALTSAVIVASVAMYFEYFYVHPIDDFYQGTPPNEGNEFTAYQGLEVATYLARAAYPNANLTSIDSWEGPQYPGTFDPAYAAGTSAVKGDGKNTWWNYVFQAPLNSSTSKIEISIQLNMDGKYSLYARSTTMLPTTPSTSIDSPEAINKAKSYSTYPNDTTINDSKVTVRYQLHSAWRISVFIWDETPYFEKYITL